VQIGSLDRITAVIGARGTGKSTWAIADAYRFSRTTGAYVIGHSPGARLPVELPSGKPLPLSWHDDIKSLQRGLRKHPDRLHIVVSGEPEAVVDFGRSLARGVKKKSIKSAGHRYRENRPIPPGVSAPPTYILIDEGTTIREGWSREERREWKEFLTGARHEHVALTWLVQAPTAKNWLLIEQSNHLRVFRYSHEWGLNAIRAAGVPQEDLAKIRALPNYHSRHYTF